jgi:hypothetical protein
MENEGFIFIVSPAGLTGAGITRTSPYRNINQKIVIKNKAPV